MSKRPLPHLHPDRARAKKKLSNSVIIRKMTIATLKAVNFDELMNIYKSGEKDRFTNYPPISLLPIFSKILENILHTRIISHLDQYKIL